MKIVYAGAPEFSVAPLKKIIESGFDVIALLTQPDKPVGRKAILTPTPLKAFALERGIPVLDYSRVRDHIAELSALGADCMVTCAYGQILTKEVLDVFPLGVYNVHASLLPKYRGASPIQQCIACGDCVTGVTVMRTDVGLDTGDMLLQREIQIAPEDTAGTLSEKLSVLGGECIVEALCLIGKGEAKFTPQDNSRACLCKKICKEGCFIDFSESAQTIVNRIRAMNPAPLCYSYLGEKLVNFFTAAVCTETGGERTGEVFRADKTGIYVRAGEGCVKILELQAEGGKKLRAADFVNGRKISVGDVFGGKR